MVYYAYSALGCWERGVFMEFDNSIPIYLQIISKIKRNLVIGVITPGDKMLSARDLAKELNINPNTAARVYNELERDGLCYTKRGVGTFITDDAILIQSIKHEMAEDLIQSFINGMLELGFEKNEMISLIKTNYRGEKADE